MEATALRIRAREIADPDFAWRTGRRFLSRLKRIRMPSPQSSPSGRGGNIDLKALSSTSPSGRGSRAAAGEGKIRSLIITVALASSLLMQSKTRADIPWPEVVQRLKIENEKLERRPGGHSGEYFIVCTLYYTPKESGFTFERGFDATRVTKSGLHGRTYPRDFLRSVMKEGCGRITTPVNGRNYIRYNGGSYNFSSAPSGGGGTLVPHFSAAAKLSGPLRRGLVLQKVSDDVQRVFGSSRWKISDTGC